MYDLPMIVFPWFVIGLLVGLAVMWWSLMFHSRGRRCFSYVVFVVPLAAALAIFWADRNLLFYEDGLVYDYERIKLCEDEAEYCPNVVAAQVQCFDDMQRVCKVVSVTVPN